MVRESAKPQDRITHGSQIASTSIGGLVLIEAFHAPNLVLPWHMHEHPRMTYLLHGSYVESYKRISHKCKSASVLIKPAGEKHSDHYGEAGARSMIVTLPTEIAEPEMFACPHLERAYLFQRGETLRIAANLYKEFRSMDSASPLIIEGLVRELIGVVARETSDKLDREIPPWLKMVRERLHDEFPFAPSIAELASAAKVHPDYLSRCFRSHYRMSIGEYARHLRMQWAARELTDSDKPLSEIALGAGFSDQSHFTRIFKQYFQTTPARFRKALFRK